MIIKDYPVSKSSSHVVFVLTDPLSFGTMLQVFSEPCTFLDSHDSCLVSPPLSDLSLSLSSLLFALGLLDSELGPVHAPWPRPSTWVRLSPVQCTWPCSDSYLWLQTLFEFQTCVLTAYGQNTWTSCRFLNLNVSQAKLNILLLSIPLRWSGRNLGVIFYPVLKLFFITNQFLLVPLYPVSW